MPATLTEIEKKLWASADELRANSKLRSADYSTPVLGLIFLRVADQRFAAATQMLGAQALAAGSRRTSGKADYQARGVIYLPGQARYAALLKLPNATPERSRLHAPNAHGERSGPAAVWMCQATHPHRAGRPERLLSAPFCRQAGTEAALRRENLRGYPAAWTVAQLETFEFYMGDLLRQKTLWNLVMLYLVPGD